MVEAEAEPQKRTANEIYTLQRFLFMTLDPVHVGAGGYRLGRVDMTIAREPGTNLPKIPGTSLAGAARSYAAMRYGRPEAAGQHAGLQKTAGTNDRYECPILYTFGTTSDSGGGQAGSVSIGDARIVLFPVTSVEGPVWVSTPEILKDAGFTIAGNESPPTDEQIVTSLQQNVSATPPAGQQNPGASDDHINLGWLMFKAQRGLTVTPKKTLEEEWPLISGRIALVT
ncbi:MAG TPA: RAMP superfamily CRISPR-associated protein, partial [Candidatus Acidoferrales bacterium]|nr:RAMP superfamily CRISPR-associated protein [Candidatus Acidoferrales bacterium]